MERARFGAGCFWQVEIEYGNVEGVIRTVVGYSGGSSASPTYEQVCSGRTGHAEVVEVEYDPAQVSYDQLLDVFWKSHDPTQLNRQGWDVGTQYRSAIFVFSPEQRQAAIASRDRVQSHSRKPIVTEIVDAGPLFPAEDYHQRYLEKRGMASCQVPATPVR